MILEIDGADIDFHQLIEYSLNSIFIVNQDGEILYCNKASLDLLALPSDYPVLHNNLFAFISPEFHPFCKKRLEKVIIKKEITKLAEKKMVKNNGEAIHVESMFVPFYLKGKVLAQVIIQDVTARKTTESRLNAQEKLASIGQIAAGIVHEVKNPLTVVKGFLQLVKESVKEPAKKTESYSYIEIIENELEKALGTMQNLLQVSKPDLHEEPCVQVNLCKELNSLLFLFQEKLYNISVETNLRNAEKMISAQRNLLLKAFFNLFKNAIEAMGNKGKLKIEHYYLNDMVHVIVSDTGVGIPKEKLPMLGTPFFTSKNDGTGLGLTQVYTTIHKHNGSVSVQSEIGKGTAFHIQLPLH